MFATSSLDVEREPAGQVTPDLRLGGLAEQRPDLVECERVGLFAELVHAVEPFGEVERKQGGEGQAV